MSSKYYSAKSQRPSDPQSFNLHEFVAKCRARWWWFAVSFVLVSLVATWRYLANVITFDVNASVMITSESGGDGGTISLARQFSLGNVLGGSGDVNNEFHMLQSHSVMLQTARQLDLNKGYTVKDGFKKIACYPGTTPLTLVCDPAIADTIRTSLEFNVKYSPSGTCDITVETPKKKILTLEKATLPAVVDLPYGQFTIAPTDLFNPSRPLKEKIQFCNYDAAAERWLKKVGMSIPDRKSDLISLAVTINDINFGKRLLDTIVANYNAKGVSDRRERDRKTAEFIDQRLRSLTEELSLSEEDIENFQKDNNLIDMGAEAQTILAKLVQLEANIESSETSLSVMEQTRDFLATPGNEYNLLPITSVNGATAYNELIMQRMKLTSSARGENSTLRTLDGQIDAMRANIMLSLNREIDTQKFKIGELRTLTSEYEGKLKKFPSEQRLFRSIERQQGVKEQLYLFLLQQREETALSIANAQPRAVIVDEAYVLADPHKMSAKTLILAILFFTLALPCGIIFLRDKLRKRVGSRREIEHLTALPILSEVSQSKNTHLVVKENHTSTVAEQFRLARANIQFILSSKNEKVVAVTSTTSGEGKTFVSINLASALSIPSSKVVLVGADVRRPKISGYLDLQPRLGLTEYLCNDDLTVDDIVLRHPVEGCNMDVIASGPVPPNPAELLMSDRFATLIDVLRGRYDYIVIDSAPMGLVSDTLAIARVADAVVYVCRVGVTRIEDFKLIDEFAGDERFRKMSLIINGTKIDRLRTYGYTSEEDK